MILRPGLSLSVEQALRAGGEVCGVGRQVFLVHDLGVLQGALESLHAVAAEGIVLRQHGDRRAFLVEGHGVGDGVLRGIAAGAEDVLVPLVAGDRIRHGGFDQQDLLVFLGDGQHGQRHARDGADGDVGVVVGIGRGQLRARHVGLALVVLLDDADLAAGHRHRALRGVLQAQHQAVLGLLGIGFQRAGLVVDVGHDEVLGHGGRLHAQAGHRGQQYAFHHGCLLMRGAVAAA